MDKYVNEETIIKDEIFESLKDMILCPLCKKLLLESIMCLNCQNQYCKKCLGKRKFKKVKCPNCKKSKTNEMKNLLIKKFKFKCIKGCGEEILYDNISKHYKSNCMKDKKKLKILAKEKVAEIKKKNKDIKYLTSKFN